MWEDYGALASMIENINRRDLKEEADTYQTGQQAKKLLESPTRVIRESMASIHIQPQPVQHMGRIQPLADPFGVEGG